MIRRLCPVPGCANFRGECTEHQREAFRKNNDLKAFYHTKHWKIVRSRQLANHPICQRCHDELADDVHHRVPLSEGGDPHGSANLMSLCKRCHGTIHGEMERATYGIGWPE